MIPEYNMQYDNHNNRLNAPRPPSPSLESAASFTDWSNQYHGEECVEDRVTLSRITRRSRMGKTTKDAQEEDDSCSTASSDVKGTSLVFAQQNVLQNFPSSRLNELSPDERLSILHDLHGTSDIVTETPELIESKLEQLDSQLSLLIRQQQQQEGDGTTRRKTKDTSAYEQAVQIDAAYVQGLRCAFLRADKFNVLKAADRMIGHFAARLKLFQSPNVLGRDIRLSDFDDQSEMDRLGLHMGIIQLLDNFDRSGRPIILINPTAAGNDMPFPQTPMLRILLWMGLVATRLGPDVQRKGSVVVWYGFGNAVDATHLERTPRFCSLFSVLSTRVNAMHACTDDRRNQSAFNTIGTAPAPEFLLRFQSHFGTPFECQCNLNRFGIPAKQILPINHSDGKIHVSHHVAFIARQKRAEHEQESRSSSNRNGASSSGSVVSSSWSSFVETPGPLDVLLGRGQHGTKSGANLMLRKLIADNHSAYFKGSSSFRTFLARMIWTQMREMGCRFLAPGGVVTIRSEEEEEPAQPRNRQAHVWVEVDESAAIDRIGHGFRNLRQKTSQQRMKFGVGETAG